MSERIFHITTLEAWERRDPSGLYRHPSLDTEGFIHCSDEAQVHATWQRIFGGARGLIVLEIDVSRLTSEIRYEEGEPGEPFPHVYGPVNADAVVGTSTIGTLG